MLGLYGDISLTSIKKFTIQILLELNTPSSWGSHMGGASSTASGSNSQVVKFRQERTLNRSSTVPQWHKPNMFLHLIKAKNVCSHHQCLAVEKGEWQLEPGSESYPSL